MFLPNIQTSDMAKYIIEGGNKLRGKVKISGNKNSALPCLSAALLTSEEVILRNIPQIADVEIFLELFKVLGAETERSAGTVKVRAKSLKTSVLPKHLVSKLRAAILLAGPLLARTGKVEFSHPGGDVIGKRSIKPHLEGLESLGFECQVSDRHYKWKDGKSETLINNVFLDEASVTATENLLLASALNQKTTILKNCACEPHVVDLCEMLVKMGVKIEGVGTHILQIEGAKQLKGVDFTIGSDYVEFGTYAIAAAITKGEIEIENGLLADLEPVIRPLQKMGLMFQEKNGVIKVSNNAIKPIPKLVTNLWPGFPTDLMSAVIILATQAGGVSLLHDWMYESRMFFVDKLISMGANITIADPHRVLVYGPSKLMGRDLETPDIRAGMALVLSALVACGRSTINRAELIDRGYENVVEKLSALGANIQRID